MKKCLWLVIATLICAFNTYAQKIGIATDKITNITKEDALRIVSKEFANRDVDYFILENNSDVNWTIFIDAEPMKGWEHECYITTVPKTSVNNIIVSPSLIERTLPPAGNFVPLQVRNRYGMNSNQKPIVATNTESNSFSSVAGRTYAVILSGGVDRISNYERYWNDCSFIYQTLTKKYGIPKENIIPIMSDGDNPAPDMLLTTGGFASQSLDIDFDGKDEIKLSAIKSNVANTLDKLQSKMHKDDHLFFFVIDHGGSTDNNTNSYICLWNRETLYDYELAQMLKPILDKKVNVNVVLGQCFAGGFNDNLSKIGCVVASACKGSESSWACPDIPYDEFVYQWTCAVNEANHNKVPVKSDADKNGFVSMDEAFKYAKSTDRWVASGRENPVYTSNPKSLGEDLAFNNIPDSVDLFIKDNDEDTGKEPNMTTDIHWRTPSICVRNNDDDVFEHENPKYATDHQMAYIYVKVGNRGKEKFEGEGKWVKIYWAQASTGLSDKSWKGREVYKNRYATGGFLEAVPIDEIEPGRETIVKIPWTLPQLLKNYPDGDFHFCLVAKIMDTPYDDGYEAGKHYFEVLKYNDIAQKNVTIIKKNELTKAFNVYVRNIYPEAKNYTLELVPQNENSASIFSRGNVEMEMSEKIYTAWERGGMQSEGLSLESNNAQLRTVKIANAQNKIKRISLNADEFDVVKVKFNLSRVDVGLKYSYAFDLIQKDEQGNIIGGETFILSNIPTVTLPEITIKQGEGGTYDLGVDSDDYDHYMWEDESGKVIGSEKSITVTPTKANHIYNVTAFTENGESGEATATLEPSFAIESVNNESGVLTVRLLNESPENGVITVTPMYNDGVKIAQNISAGQSTISIDTSVLEPGMYIVTYTIASEVIDSVKTTINK